MSGERSWVLTIAFILAFDAALVATGKESLSECYARTIRRPVAGVATVATTAYLVGHLSGLYGKSKYDPLHLAAEVIRLQRRSTRPPGNVLNLQDGIVSGLSGRETWLDSAEVVRAFRTGRKGFTGLRSVRVLGGQGRR